MLRFKNDNPSIGEDSYSLAFVMEFANKGSLWRMLKKKKKKKEGGDEDEGAETEAEADAEAEVEGKDKGGYVFDLGDIKQIIRYCSDLQLLWSTTNAE